jgi:hypothetical protein
VRVCPRLCERLGLLRLRAAVSVRLRREADWECACRGAAGPRSHVKGQSGAASLCRDPAREETMRGKPARALAGFPIGLLAAAGPPLLLFKELFRVGRCMGYRGNAGKHR